MKIALFSDTFPPEINGVSVSVDLHQRILSKQGHEVLVITTNPFGRHLDMQPNLIRIPGLELKKLYGYRLSTFFSAKVYQQVKKWQPDLIHIHTDAGIGIFGKIVAFFLKVPTVVTYHTMYEDYTHYAGFLKGLANRVVRQFSKSIAEQCTEFIAPSNKTKDRIRSYGVDRFINIVPTGVDFSRFDLQQLDAQRLLALRQQWVKPNEKIILSLGRVAKEKSIDVLIRGFNQLPKDSLKPLRLLIVGDGPDRPELQRLVSSLALEDRVSFVGAVPIQDVPYYYHLGDVFASASVTETQGLTFMEAMASQRMILCRYDENLAGLIQHQQSGFIFTDAEDFARQVLAIFALTPTKQQAILTNMNQVLQPYNLSSFYVNLLEVYQRAQRQYW
jgi:1,2-diacylglycerol 3-alpha-glucosyltransferase